jgi:hypothetical protein
MITHNTHEIAEKLLVQNKLHKILKVDPKYKYIIKHETHTQDSDDLTSCDIKYIFTRHLTDYQKLINKSIKEYDEANDDLVDPTGLLSVEYDEDSIDVTLEYMRRCNRNGYYITETLTIYDLEEDECETIARKLKRVYKEYLQS